MWAKIITIKRTKDLNYFSLCALNLFNTWVSQFELNYWNKWTFPRHSNLLRCTCHLLTPMSSKMFLYFAVENKLWFLIKTFPEFSPFSELQWTPNSWRQNYSFSAASKGYKRYQTMNKSYLAKRSVIQKSTNKWMCFINTFIMHSWRHVIRNYTEKVTLECLQVERTNTKSNGIYKNRELQLNEFTRKNNNVEQFWTWRRRWDGAYVKRDLFNIITYNVKSGTRIAEQAIICL